MDCDEISVDCDEIRSQNPESKEAEYIPVVVRCDFR